MPAARFSVTFYPPGDGKNIIRLARIAEQLGFDTFWIPDSHMIWGDPYVLLGAVAASTERIRLGPGVTHPLVRHVTVTASAIATLGEMAPGRVRLGIGIGSSGPATIGVRRSGARELETAIRTIRTLVRGEQVQQDERDLRLTFTNGQDVSISVGAISEHTLRVAGRVADGAIFSGPIDGLGDCLRAVQEGEAAANRPRGSVSIALITPLYVDDDRKRAQDAVKPIVARTALVWLTRAARSGTIDDADREPWLRLQREYDPYRHMTAEYNRLVEERWLERFSLSGTADEVLRRCQRALAAGASEIIVNLLGPDGEAQMRRFGEEILPRLAGDALPSSR